MFKFLTIGVFIIFTHQGFSQSKDTIVDSHYTWKDLKKIFELEYFDATKNHFSTDQKLLVRQLLDSDLVVMDVTYWALTISFILDRLFATNRLLQI